MAVCQECWQFNYVIYSRSQCGILQYEPTGWDFAQKLLVNSLLNKDYYLVCVLNK